MKKATKRVLEELAPIVIPVGFIFLLELGVYCHDTITGKRGSQAEVTTTTCMTETTTETTTTTTITTTTDMTETTTTTTMYILTLDENFQEPDYVLFDWSDRTVHTKDCTCNINEETTQKIYGYDGLFFIDEGRPCSVCKPIVTIGHMYIPDDSYLQLDTTTYNVTYYGNYNYAPVYGASGRELITYFSAASDTIPLGTYVYVKSDDGTIDSCYRIDDTGPGYGTIDLYYNKYDLVQPKFRQDGRMSCKVWIIRDPN